MEGVYCALIYRRNTEYLTAVLEYLIYEKARVCLCQNLKLIQMSPVCFLCMEEDQVEGILNISGNQRLQHTTFQF